MQIAVLESAAAAKETEVRAGRTSARTERSTLTNEPTKEVSMASRKVTRSQPNNRWQVFTASTGTSPAAIQRGALKAHINEIFSRIDVAGRHAAAGDREAQKAHDRLVTQFEGARTQLKQFDRRFRGAA